MGGGDGVKGCGRLACHGGEIEAPRDYSSLFKRNEKSVWRGVERPVTEDDSG